MPSTRSDFFRRKALSRPLATFALLYALGVLAIAVLAVLYSFTYNLQP